ncbi:tyrosine-type recombinase/integrase, partial [bacterium]|nr:tyrosine-type recombinase/integrase [bacterium]
MSGRTETRLKLAQNLRSAPRQRVRHIPALPWSDVPAFYASLDAETPTHLALRLLILTGMRSAPVRHIRADQVDLDAMVWTVPVEVMKGRVGQSSDFRVPLSTQAADIVRTASGAARGGLLFPGARGGAISDMTLSMFMRRAGLEARPHGFRTSLRVWLAEQTDAPREVAETILAH